MAPPDSNATDRDVSGLAVAVGRIEATLNAMSKNEENSAARMDRLERGMSDLRLEVQSLKSQQKPRTPWTAIVGAVAAIVAAGGGLIAIFMTLSKIADVVAHLS